MSNDMGTVLLKLTLTICKDCSSFFRLDWVQEVHHLRLRISLQISIDFELQY